MTPPPRGPAPPVLLRFWCDACQVVTTSVRAADTADIDCPICGQRAPRIKDPA
jgi:Zn finger protein HypA/HybF involved in hydrogenase expression